MPGLRFKPMKTEFGGQEGALRRVRRLSGDSNGPLRLGTAELGGWTRGRNLNLVTLEYLKIWIYSQVIPELF